MITDIDRGKITDSFQPVRTILWNNLSVFSDLWLHGDKTRTTNNDKWLDTWVDILQIACEVKDEI